MRGLKDTLGPFKILRANKPIASVKIEALDVHEPHVVGSRPGPLKGPGDIQSKAIGRGPGGEALRSFKVLWHF